MRSATIEKYAAAVPRYTSYPTAPHFGPNVDAATYGRWLGEIAEGAPASLYVHIPFCQEMCWYCGCTTKATRRHEPIARYLDALEAEIAQVSASLGGRPRIEHIHWGGGSPSILAAADIARLAATLRRHFDLAAKLEFAVEIDPRGLGDDAIRAFAAAGVNRVSVGVQDFAEDVQRAINRMQSSEQTRDVIEAFRRVGVGGINIDLVYGLPHQTPASVKDTLSRVLRLAPDRIALFGYAHLPSRITHQRLIDESVLPDTASRFAQAASAAAVLEQAGYERVGLDHFARPDDPLAQPGIRRNFQGYTTDAAPVLIGLGASSIGYMPQGYVQNTPAIAEYERRVLSGTLATARGHAMSEDDAARALIIERLMCDFRFPAAEMRRRFPQLADALLA
ncbi:MAG: oxygen-independent coproporphyrinogen III oxidase, partial [Hyphomicrobiaceae bacterium]